MKNLNCLKNTVTYPDFRWVFGFIQLTKKKDLLLLSLKKKIVYCNEIFEPLCNL